MGDLNAPVLGSVVLASATSWLVLRLILGNHPLFSVPQYRLIHPLELIVYAVLGVVGGLTSVAFTKLLLGMRKRFLQFPQKSLWVQPVVGGLLVGLMGWFVPQVRCTAQFMRVDLSVQVFCAANVEKRYCWVSMSALASPHTQGERSCLKNRAQ